MSELSFRLSREGDIPALQRLWAEVFGDGEEFTGEFFRLLWRREYCRVAEAGGEIAAMGFCIPGAVARARAALTSTPWRRRSGTAASARRGR